MRKLLFVGALFGALAIVSAAQAATCDDLVVDEVGLKGFDIGKVTAAARRASSGATVRIRIVRSLGSAKNIYDLEKRYERECWQVRGVRLSNLLFIPLSMEHGDIDVAVGGALTSRITKEVANDGVRIMTPHFKAHQRGESGALTAGFVGMLDFYAAKLEQAARGSSGPTTIVHNEAGDGSWVWKTFLVIAIGGGAILFALLFLRSRQDGGNIKAAQQRARGAFSDCVSRVEAISNPKYVSDRKFAIDALDGTLPAKTITNLRKDLGNIADYASSARTALTRFLPDQEKDPNPNGLSAEAYQSNESACTDMIVHFVKPAETLAQKIDETVNSAPAAKVA